MDMEAVTAALNTLVTPEEAWDRATGWHSYSDYTQSRRVAQVWRDEGREVMPVCAAACAVREDRVRDALGIP